MCTCVFFFWGGGDRGFHTHLTSTVADDAGKSLFNRSAERHLAGNPDVMAVDAEAVHWAKHNLMGRVVATILSFQTGAV